MVVGFLLIGGLQFPNDLCNVDQLVVVFYLETKNPVNPLVGAAGSSNGISVPNFYIYYFVRYEN